MATVSVYRAFLALCIHTGIAAVVLDQRRLPSGASCLTHLFKPLGRLCSALRLFDLSHPCRQALISAGATSAKMVVTMRIPCDKHTPAYIIVLVEDLS